MNMRMNPKSKNVGKIDEKKENWKNVNNIKDFLSTNPDKM